MSPLTYLDGAYRSPPRRISWLAKFFPGVVFYWKALWIVLRASRQAKKSQYDSNEWAKSSWEVLKALESVGLEFEITGVEHLQNVEGPWLVIGNHKSTLETMVLPCLVQPFHETIFVIKKSLLEYPIFKHVMASRDPVPVTQTDPRNDLKAMLQGGMERLKKGVSLIVFPEGERTPVFESANFNSIGVKLAGRAKVPIIPFALETSAWGLGKIVGDVGKIDPSRKVHFAFGPPIYVEGRGNDEHQQIIDFISEKLQTWENKRQ